MATRREREKSHFLASGFAYDLNGVRIRRPRWAKILNRGSKSTRSYSNGPAIHFVTLGREGLGSETLLSLSRLQFRSASFENGLNFGLESDDVEKDAASE